MNEKLKDGLYFILVAAAGMAVVSAAPYAAPHTWTEPPYGLPRLGIESFSRVSALGLLLVGLFAGCLRPKKAWLWGWASMALYPVWACIEMGQDPTSHNLWPLEFMMYAVESLCAVVGAYLGGRFSPFKK